MGKKTLLWFVVAFLSFGGFSFPVSGQNVKDQSTYQYIQNSRANDAFWSVTVCDSTGTILEDYNSQKLVRPASNLKLLTSAAILDQLGPDFTFTTTVYGIGHKSGSTWKGDIIIRGSGDPSISGTFYNEDRFHVFDKFYTALDSMGIRRIEGNLIGNDSFFDQQPYPKNWSWQDLSFYYGVEISALSFNNNAVDLRVYADGEVGSTPRIEWFPFDTDYVNFENEQVITPPGSEYDEFYRRILGTNTILLRSKLPQHYVEKESLSIKNAPRFFLDTFKQYLEDGGIAVTGGIIVDSQNTNWQSDKYQPLVKHQSVPLQKMITQINKESSNFYTEMLLKTMAAVQFDAPGSTDLGLHLVEDFAASMKMDTTKIELTDGSGMAASTLLKPSDLSKMLVTMSDHPHFEVYKNSLSVAGIDGSLKKRFADSPVRGKLYGKTGYLSGVRSLSGYLDTSSGQTVAFTIATNNYTQKTSYIDSVHKKIVQHIYQKY